MKPLFIPLWDLLLLMGLPDFYKPLQTPTSSWEPDVGISYFNTGTRCVAKGRSSSPCPNKICSQCSWESGLVCLRKVVHTLTAPPFLVSQAAFLDKIL